MTGPFGVLHDHLDGGLRPSTILELADEIGYANLPARDVAGLEAWFLQGRAGSLPRYLEAFDHTIAVMQTPEAVARVAREAVEDLLADGVVYAELRFAPLLFTRGGMSGDDVIEAALSGMRDGAGDRMTCGLIVDAMRSADDSDRVADLTIRWMDGGVIGFDLAGPEKGFPADLHLPAIRRVAAHGVRVTLHAGEAGGVPEIARALRCGAERIGHGVDIIDDCVVADGEIVELGRVASAVRDRQIVLELCPSSNLHTKGWTLADHPFGMLHRAGFAVTVNTDNRLMSGTSMSHEFEILIGAGMIGPDDVPEISRRTVAAGFVSHDAVRRVLSRLA